MQNNIITHKLDDWGNMDPAEARNMWNTQKQFEKEFGDDSFNINIGSEDHNKFTISVKTIIDRKLIKDDDFYTHKQFVCPAV